MRSTTLTMSLYAGDEPTLLEEIRGLLIADLSKNVRSKHGYKVVVSVTAIDNKPRVKKEGLAVVKKQLLDLVRRYVFLRDGSYCISCSSVFPGQIMELGHFIAKSASNTALKYEPDNCVVQCYNCNRKMGSNSHRDADMIAGMKRKFGEQRVVELLSRKNYIVQWRRADYERQIRKVKGMIVHHNQE